MNGLWMDDLNTMMPPAYYCRVEAKNTSDKMYVVYNCK